MKTNFSKLSRLFYGTLALAVAGAATLPALSGTASAGQVTSRSITMSNSRAGNNGGTGVTYTVAFTAAASADPIHGIVVDFCSNSPIPGDACTAPTGFAAAATGTAPTFGVQTGGTWVASAINTGRTFVYKNTGTATGTPTTVSFTMTGVTNPNTVGSFYARILTFDDDVTIDTWDNTADGSDTANVTGDQGGVALSVATALAVTARVMETLTFCVATTSPAANCDGGSPVNAGITLGEGTPKALSTSAQSTATSYTQVSTNATSGTSIRFKTNNTCGGLSKDGGTTCEIASAGSGGNAIAAGTAAFGLKVGAAGAGHTSVAPYNGANFYLDTANAITTNGSQIVTSAAPTSSINQTYNYAASAATATPAGVYTATLTFIATGNF